MGLNPQQQQAVDTIEGPLLILAGAGSGKTTVLMNRIAKMIESGISPWKILAVTFTNKAANEMKERIQKMIGSKANDVWMSTFHSMCVRILRYEIDSIPYLEKNFSIYDGNGTKTLIRRIMKELGYLAKKGDEESTGTAKPETIIGAISALKNEMIDVESYKSNRATSKYIDWEKAVKVIQNTEDIRHILLDVYPRYQEELIKSNALDFDDLILATIKLFLEHPIILEKYQEKFHYIMVDEYQDTNRAQYVLVTLLAQKYRNIAVVGDDFQSIYAFRGSDIRNILNFDLDYPNAKVIKLEQNYRSTKTIIALANQVISKNKQQKKKVLFTENENGQKVQVVEAYLDSDEAEYISEQIKGYLRKGFTLNDVAVLYRNNYQSGILETILNRNGISNQVVGGIGYWNRMEILDVISYLQFLSNPNSTAHFERIANKPKRGIGDTTVQKIISTFVGGNFISHLKTVKLSKKARESVDSFIQLVEPFLHKKETLSASLLIKELVKDSNYLSTFEKEDRIKQRDRKDNINQLVGIALDYENKNGGFVLLDNFMEEVVLRNVNEDESEENDEKVTLMTIHASKGLEFPIVFVIGMNEKIFPAAYSETDEDMEEETRIMYVASTRAKKHLHLSYQKFRLSQKRDAFGRAEKNQLFPSRFLSYFDPNLAEYSEYRSYNHFGGY